MVPPGQLGSCCSLRNRTSGLWVDTSRPSVQSMSTLQTTLTPIPEGELRKKGPPRRNPLGRMETGSNADDRRMPLLRHLHRWPLALRVNFPMKKKNEVLSHFQKLKSRVEKEIGWHIQCLRSDRGKEYFCYEIISYLQGEGLQREFSCRHTPQQNGVAERKNQQILEVARAMMREMHMLNFY